jgi:hypothetical protein
LHEVESEEDVFGLCALGALLLVLGLGLVLFLVLGLAVPHLSVDGPDGDGVGDESGDPDGETDSDATDVCVWLDEA